LSNFLGLNRLSVIIPTRNRSDLLQLALLSLQTQTLPANQLEILVIAPLPRRPKNRCGGGKPIIFFDPEPGQTAWRAYENLGRSALGLRF